MSDTDRSLVSTEILVSGSPIKDTYEILDINVTKEVNRVAAAEISVLDGSAAQEDFPVSEGSEFVPGNDIEIKVGWGTKTASIFQGVIIAQAEKIDETGPLLRVICRDKALKMTIGRKSAVYEKQKDSDVMSTLAGNAGVSTDIKATSAQIPQLVQYYVTDWDFLLLRAEVNGMVVVAADNKVSVQPPAASGPELTLTYGTDLVELDATLSAAGQLAAVEAKAWDYKSQALTSSSASKPSVPSVSNLTGDKLASVVSPSTVNLASTVALDTGALKSWADGTLLKSRLSKIMGHVKAYGDADLKPNSVVELKGVGDRFNGKAFVSGVEHDVRGGAWWSILTIGLTPFPFAEQVQPTYQPAAGLLGGIRGVQNATVKAMYNDPDSETRVQVTVPMFTTDGQPGDVWARWLQPYATSGAGFFFLPEVGDEVMVAFLNEDPRYPVILGSVYSSNKAPPLQPADKNPKKTIVSNSKITVEFDDENKVLTIKTPGENKMVFSDQDKSILIQDQNSNKIEMNDSGITIQSPKDITIKATGNINATGTGGVTVKSDAAATVQAATALNLKGLNISIAADAQLSAQGSAQTEVKSGGITSVKGSLVQIN